MLKNILCRVQNSSILKNLLVLGTGSALAQVIGVLASPVLSRLYTPEQFGVLGSILAVTGVISVIGSLKYEMALVLEKDDAKAQALQKLCLIILIVVTFISGIGILAVPYCLTLEGKGGLTSYLPWAIPIIFLTGLFNIFNFRLNREKKYKTLSSALVARRLSNVVLQIVLGFCGAQVLGLVLGNLFGAIVAVLVIVITQKGIAFDCFEEGASLKNSAREHYRFPLYSAPQNLLNALSQNLPIYLLGYFYGMEVVGSYWFAMRIIQLPASLIGQAVRQVFYKEAADLSDNLVELRKVFIKTTLLLAVVIVIPVIVIFLWGPHLFPFVFGDKWLLAGQFSRWMFLWVGLLFINPPAVMLFNILHFQKYSLIIDIFLIIARACSLLLGGYYLWTAENTVALYSLVGVFFNIFVILFIHYKLNKLNKLNKLGIN